jgi:hypothetical protein
MGMIEIGDAGGIFLRAAARDVNKQLCLTIGVAALV